MQVTWFLSSKKIIVFLELTVSRKVNTVSFLFWLIIFEKSLIAKLSKNGCLQVQFNSIITTFSSYQESKESGNTEDILSSRFDSLESKASRRKPDEWKDLELVTASFFGVNSRIPDESSSIIQFILTFSSHPELKTHAFVGC